MITLSIITLYALFGLGLVSFGEQGRRKFVSKNVCFFLWPVILIFCALKRIWG